MHNGELVYIAQFDKNIRKGTRTQNIDVYLKYIGKFAAPDSRSPEDIEAERIAEEKLQRKRQQKRDSERRRRERIRAAEVAITTQTNEPLEEAEPLTA